MVREWKTTDTHECSRKSRPILRIIAKLRLSRDEGILKNLNVLNARQKRLAPNKKGGIQT